MAFSGTVQLREGSLAALMPLVPRARAGRGAGGLDPGGGGELGLQQLTSSNDICCQDRGPV